ncbi:puromycin-sensitive aminopeptidase-like [Brachionus plicatilis]|uniref:Aminopeptidase n=1 Tax=Brachionus plicatilis TaxID=10195 RepID=A0A3M7QCU3_BRAPC|nr:puromycin-sensitive aminopeptidase-like [Brachionus plicatilis]
MSSTEFVRLPKNVLPVNYTLELQPDFTNFTFTGRVDIDVKVSSETNTVLLNSAELSFKEAVFETATGTKMTSSDVKLDEPNELATIVFPQALPIGLGKLHISYTGILNDKLKGFYRSKYVHPSGEERYAATTQFEAADARRALPCWDEPALKATFDVTIIAEENKTVLSNMPLLDAKQVEGNQSLRRFRFDRTPIMSTYLLAFVIGEYDYIEDKDRNGVLIRVYTPLGKQELGRFALEVAVKTLPFYTDYFRISYPLPKLDLIAIADFAAGAMENWGLVTYRETALLVDPKNSSLMSKQTVAIVVGHELAHQWFGNIVTMEWWTHLWLNEGFASWIEYLCVDHCLPELDIWTHFVNSDYCRALELDSLKNSHPIEVPVGPPSEVDEIFDAISYSKGATAIRMLHSYIGDDAFRTGLHNYLEKFKYRNAVTEDLWEALTEASKKPVNQLMDLWTSQTGYPYINISHSINPSGETVLQLSQQRFFSNGAKPTEEENFLWKVPITVVTKSSYPNVHKEILLEKRTDELNLGVLGANDWIKLNKNTIGMYRSNYSPELLLRLSSVIREQTLHPTDRLGLQSDVFALSQAGLLSAADVLKFLEGYSAEENVTVWRDLVSNLMSLSHTLLNTDFQPQFQAFVVKLLKPISTKLGWDPIQDESGLQGMCRATVLRTLGINGDRDTIDEAKRRLEAHFKGNLIPADLRSAVYSSALYDSEEALLDKLIDLHNKSDLQEEKMRIATSLGSVRSEALIKKVLHFALSPSVRSQDSVTVICAVCSNTSTKLSSDLTWQFVKENWDTIHSRYSSGFLITRLCKTVSENFATQKDYEDVEAFFKAHPVAAAQRSIQQGLESIQVNQAWLKRDEQKLRSFLSA